MAEYPKVVHGPTEVSPGKWEALAVAVMPCSKTIQGSGKGSELKSVSKARNKCDEHIRRHLSTCNKCPEKAKKAYG